MSDQTYWNGQPTPARKVRVIVGPSPRPTWWCANLAGSEREAVEVTYFGDVFYLDNMDGSGWAKVTAGRGSPQWGHSELPMAEVKDPAPVGERPKGQDAEERLGAKPAEERAGAQTTGERT